MRDSVHKKELVLLFGALLIVGVIFLIGSFSSATPVTEEEPVACTADAMMCPDGSYVGRTGPDCQFVCPVSEAPGGVSALPLQATTTPEGMFSFDYPEKLPTTYISLVDWPPVLSMSSQPFTCVAAGDEAGRAGQTELRLVNGKEYCRTIVSEGAAGSIYKQYAYSMSTWDKVLTMTFTTKEVQCGNYDEPKKSECEAERASFNVDIVVDRIMTSVKEVSR